MGITCRAVLSIYTRDAQKASYLFPLITDKINALKFVDKANF